MAINLHGAATRTGEKSVWRDVSVDGRALLYEFGFDNFPRESAMQPSDEGILEDIRGNVLDDA